MDLNAKYEKLLLLMNLVICILKWVMEWGLRYRIYSQSCF
jgi:hypothetical protein